MKKLLLTLIVSGATLAFADANPMYVQLQAGASFSPNFNSGTDGAGAVRADIGYMFNKYVGLEGGFTGTTNPANTSAANSNQNISNGNIPSALQFYDVSVKGVLPLGELFDLHGQIGGAYVSGGGNGAGGNNADIKGLLAAGIGFNVSKQFTITVNDYQYLAAEAGSLSGSGGNTNIVMGGIAYNF